MQSGQTFLPDLTVLTWIGLSSSLVKNLFPIRQEILLKIGIWLWLAEQQTAPKSSLLYAQPLSHKGQHRVSISFPRGRGLRAFHPASNALSSKAHCAFFNVVSFGILCRSCIACRIKTIFGLFGITRKENGP